jgi:phosphatidylserine decarboxylase
MIHKEGIKIILVILLMLTVLNVAVFYFSGLKTINYMVLVLSVVFFLLVLWFFRNPDRKLIPNDNIVYSPADGKVVLIEKVFDKEYYQAERMQVSIFMSPLDVHVNRYSISGTIKYAKYYPGKYLVAWHPKSSEKNERSVLVIENSENSILLKQIAGAVARRIVTYGKEGDTVQQGDQLGFIKFGSRMDILLPPDAKIHVKIGDKVNGNIHKIASFR